MHVAVATVTSYYVLLYYIFLMYRWIYVDLIALLISFSRLHAVTFLKCWASLFKITHQKFALSVLNILNSNKDNVPDEHYKMDLSSRKEASKLMVYDELMKLAEADED
jgi:hypothetical protein